MENEMTKEKLVELLENYLWRITRANDCLQVYKTIVNAKQTRLNEMEYACSFFSIAEDSICNDLAMTTAKLFDEGNTMSIKKLINICNQNRDCFLSEAIIKYQWADAKDKGMAPYRECFPINIDSDIKKAYAELETLQPKIDNLKTRRDKYYAHSDKKYVFEPNTLQNDAPLSFNDVEGLLDFAGKVCNNFLYNITRRRFIPHTYDNNDLMNLLDRLHDCESNDAETSQKHQGRMSRAENCYEIVSMSFKGADKPAFT